MPGKMFSTCCSLALIWLFLNFILFFFYPQREVTMCARTASSSWLTLKQKPRPTPHSLTRSLRILRTSVTCWDRPCLHWLEPHRSEGFMNCVECSVCMLTVFFSLQCKEYVSQYGSEVVDQIMSMVSVPTLFMLLHMPFCLKKSLHAKIPF